MKFQKQNTELECSTLGWHDKVLAAGAAGGLCEGCLEGHSRFQPAPAAPLQGTAASSSHPGATSAITYLEGKMPHGSVREAKPCEKQQPCKQKVQRRRRGQGRASTEGEMCWSRGSPTAHGEDHHGADAHTAARGGRYGGGYFLKAWQPLEKPYCSRFLLTRTVTRGGPTLDQVYPKGLAAYGEDPCWSSSWRTAAHAGTGKEFGEDGTTKNCHELTTNPHSPSPTLLVAEEIKESGMEAWGMKEWSWAWGRQGLGKMF